MADDLDRADDLEDPAMARDRLDPRTSPASAEERLTALMVPSSPEKRNRLQMVREPRSTATMSVGEGSNPLMTSTLRGETEREYAKKEVA